MLRWMLLPLGTLALGVLLPALASLTEPLVGVGASQLVLILLISALLLLRGRLRRTVMIQLPPPPWARQKPQAARVQAQAAPRIPRQRWLPHRSTRPTMALVTPVQTANVTPSWWQRGRWQRATQAAPTHPSAAPPPPPLRQRLVGHGCDAFAALSVTFTAGSTTPRATVLHPATQIAQALALSSGLVDETVTSVRIQRQTVTLLLTTERHDATRRRQLALQRSQPGVRVSWHDPTQLTYHMGRGTVAMGIQLPSVRAFPILQQRQGQLWWVLDHLPHLCVVGDWELLLGGLPIPSGDAPPLAVDDPHGLLAGGGGRVPLLHQAEALADLHAAQQQTDFARRQGMIVSSAPRPILLSVAPDRSRWQVLHPLLRPDSVAHVILLMGEAVQLPEVLPMLHQLAVVETHNPRLPPLPDAGRPAHLRMPPVGQVLAWQAGGRRSWRGRPCGITESR